MTSIKKALIKAQAVLIFKKLYYYLIIISFIYTSLVSTQMEDQYRRTSL